MKQAAFGIGGLLAIAGCAAPESATGPVGAGAPATAEARADIRNAVGQMKGQSTATELGDSVRVRVAVSAMPTGSYGAHVHTTGRCDAPAFASAGPHWNPTARQHGKNNPNGQHHGDLPNLAVGTDGRGSFEITIPAASLRGGTWPAILDSDGAAIVIHAKADDYRTDPSGNSGDRIGCGVFR